MLRQDEVAVALCEATARTARVLVYTTVQHCTRSAVMHHERRALRLMVRNVQREAIVR